MSEKRAEPFILALGELRARLRAGEAPLDTRLAATEIAAELGLSATPVREALSRLAGEGLLDDRRGEGFFVRRLGRADIAALYNLSRAHLALAIDGWASEPSLDASREETDPADPVAATEWLFAVWVAAGGSRVLAQAFGRIQAQLGPARRLEPRLFDDLPAEAQALLARGLDRAERLRRLRAFHARRVRAAGALADLLEQGAERHTL